MIGKVNDDFFRRAILPHTGAKDPQVVVGPHMGVDAAVLKMDDQYLVIAEDPIFPGPTMSPDDFGWITVHIGASDVAVMGVDPRFMTYSLLLPPGTSDEYIAELVKSISNYARELGIAVVGGHTGFYGAVTVPTIGGITVWGTGQNVVTPAGAQVGDAVIITKGAAVEAAALLAYELEEKLLADGIEKPLVNRAKKRLYEMSVVADARVAMEVGGVHAMHDATEGGLTRGLWEVAEASGVGLRLERCRVPVPDDIRVICEYFELDPFEVISEGTLVLTCDPQKTDSLLSAFKNSGLEAAVIGKVVDHAEGRTWVEKDGRQTKLLPPPADRFWDVFFNALAMKDDRRTSAEVALCRELSQAVKELQEVNIFSLIPEIGTNIAYALPQARELKDVAAIPGRLLRFKGKTIALGEPEMGCSGYMGSTVLTVREFFPEARCVVNLRYSERIRKACDNLGFKIVALPVPQDYRQDDAGFYRDLRKTLSNCSELPDVIEVPDRINLERLVILVDRNLEALVAKIKALAQKLAEPEEKNNNYQHISRPISV